jgi:hypothetical protein
MKAYLRAAEFMPDGELYYLTKFQHDQRCEQESALRIYKIMNTQCALISTDYVSGRLNNR